jgi:hypothetical protein
MISIITGDIINSRKINSDEWLPQLKDFLATIGSRPKIWDIYRGDSFQVQAPILEALKIAIIIKSIIKQKKEIDVRMSIGIGKVQYDSERITESYGTAFINSGESLENMHKNKLSICTPIEEINDYFQIILKLLSLSMDNWKPATAATIFHALTYETLNQKDLSQLMKKKPATISEALKRGGYSEIQATINLYKEKIQRYV